MKNPYETLGVKPNATPAEIKRAYRKASSRAHPDKKNGNAPEMALINTANDILSNPQRRAQFDSTGTTDLPRTLTQEATAFLMQTFAAVLQTPDINIISTVTEDISLHRANAKKDLAEMVKKRKVLQKRRAKVHCTGPQNLVHMLIDQQLAQIDTHEAKCNHLFAVLDEAEKLLKNYKSEEIIVPDDPWIRASTHFVRF